MNVVSLHSRPKADNDNTQPARYGNPRTEEMVIFALDCAPDYTPPSMKGMEQFRLWCLSRAVPFKEVKGCYRGKEEPAFVTPWKAFKAFQIGETWCARQGSILYLSTPWVDRQRRAELLTPLPPYRPIKPYVPTMKWWAVSEEAAKRQDSWTCDPEALTPLGCKGKAAEIYWVAALEKPEEVQ